MHHKEVTREINKKSSDGQNNTKNTKTSIIGVQRKKGRHQYIGEIMVSHFLKVSLKNNIQFEDNIKKPYKEKP